MTTIYLIALVILIAVMILLAKKITDWIEKYLN